MNNIGKDGAEHAAEYIGAMKGTWPLVMLAGSIALASAARQLKRGYRQRTRRQQVVTVLLNAILTSSLAVGCALMLPVIIPNVTAEMQIAVSMVLSSLGGETMKIWFLEKLGLSVVDLMNEEDVRDVRSRMSPEQRKAHLEQCPFVDDEN